MNEITLVSAPENPYKKPKGVKNKIFKVGDIVLTCDKNIGTIIEIQEGFRDRADKWHNEFVYCLNLNHLSGSPRILFMGWELEKMDVVNL